MHIIRRAVTRAVFSCYNYIMKNIFLISLLTALLIPCAFAQSAQKQTLDAQTAQTAALKQEQNPPEQPQQTEPAESAAPTEAQNAGAAANTAPAEAGALEGEDESAQKIPAQSEEQENKKDTLETPPDKTAASALSVARLPDIKLNENVIRKSVLSYASPQELEEAANLYRSGDIKNALNAYQNAAAQYEAAARPEIAAQAYANAAVLNLYADNLKQASAAAQKASALDEQEPFYKTLEVWTLAAEGQTKKAHKAYDALLFLTADFEYVSNAKNITALSDFYAKDYKNAVPMLQSLYVSNPYIISNVIYFMGRANFNSGDCKTAKTLFEQALSHDNNNYMAQKYLAQCEEKLKLYVPAWQSYADIFSLDSNDKFISEKIKKLSKHLKAPALEYLPYNQSNEIYSKKPDAEKSTPVKVGLFTSRSAQITPLEEFTYVGAADFTVKDEKLGDVLNVEAFISKTIVFDKEHKGAHIKNKWNNAEFSTRRPFIIELQKEGYTFLIKDARANNIFAANLGDKELKGKLLVVPSDEGLLLVNYSGLEDILPSSLMSLTRNIKTPAALEAAATALRTYFLSVLGSGGKNTLFDISDNSPFVTYGGINMQAQYAKEAARATKDAALVKEDNTLAAAGIYRSCGFVTDEGIKNTLQKYDYSFTPVNLFKYTLSNMPQDLFSAPKDPSLWSSVKWIYAMPAKEIESRFKQKYPKLGALKYFEPSQFSPSGRILKMRFYAAKGEAETSFDEADFILSAGTLRSNFFIWTPLGKGSAKEYLFMGTDTGLGGGLCLESANGLANEGKTSAEILEYFYPALKTSTQWQIPKSLI